MHLDRKAISKKRFTLEKIGPGIAVLPKVEGVTKSELAAFGLETAKSRHIRVSVMKRPLESQQDALFSIYFNGKDKCDIQVRNSDTHGQLQGLDIYDQYFDNRPRASTKARLQLSGVASKTIFLAEGRILEYVGVHQDDKHLIATLTSLQKGQSPMVPMIAFLGSNTMDANAEIIVFHEGKILHRQLNKSDFYEVISNYVKGFSA